MPLRNVEPNEACTGLHTAGRTTAFSKCKHIPPSSREAAAEGAIRLGWDVSGGLESDFEDHVFLKAKVGRWHARRETEKQRKHS